MDYAKAKIYKIWSPIGDKIYIGSTTKEYLSQRMTTHRGNYNHWKKGKGHMITAFNLFEEYGIENCFIELLEAKPCKSKDELKQFEGSFIRTLKCVNKYIPDRTQKEYQQDNKEKKLEYDKNYYEQNKDKILEKKLEKITCQCGCFITKQGSKSSKHIQTKKHINGVNKNL